MVDDAASSATGEPIGRRSFRQVRFERPAGSTEILLVRHGESAEAGEGDLFALVDGRGDPELSETGHVQARALALRLAGMPIDALYVTQLRRTAETAAPLAECLGLVPMIEPGLVEVHMGAWEGGIYRRRIADKDPLAAEVFRAERWDVVPGAESNEALSARTSDAMQRVAAAHPGSTVVIVTHAVVISTVLAWATGSRPFAFVSVDNASISSLVLGDHWTLRRFNDTAHLEQPSG